LQIEAFLALKRKEWFEAITGYGASDDGKGFYLAILVRNQQSA